jgi:hypothetical protein
MPHLFRLWLRSGVIDGQRLDYSLFPDFAKGLDVDDFP